MMDGDSMKSLRLIIILIIPIISISSAGQLNNTEKKYSNPILDKNFADPTVIKASNGL